MTSVQEATDIVMSELWEPQLERVPLSEATGRVLAEDILADRDFPPFDRVMMDGIAIRSVDFEAGTREFKVQGLLPAGSPAMTLENGPNCLEIMTGAVMALNADVVVRYEDVEIIEGRAKVNVDSVIKGRNIHVQGSDRSKGSLLIAKHKMISDAEIGILSTVGVDEVLVLTTPRVLIVSTGDELVDIEDTPLPHQIRKSNVHMLVSLCSSLGIRSRRLHLTDDLDGITESLRKEIEMADVILLSGGVSKGKLDFLPEALEKLGIEKRFHRLKQRPGKPFWFGKNHQVTVFAFPGNPVSTYMCAKRYFEPWVREAMKMTSLPLTAQLTSEFTFKPELQYFLQCKVAVNDEGILQATPVPGQGSGDLANLVEADGFLELPAERTNFESGQSFRYWPYRKL